MVDPINSDARREKALRDKRIPHSEFTVVAATGPKWERQGGWRVEWPAGECAGEFDERFVWHGDVEARAEELLLDFCRRNTPPPLGIMTTPKS